MTVLLDHLASKTCLRQPKVKSAHQVNPTLGLVGGWSGEAAGLLLSETWQHTHSAPEKNEIIL
jgi:hypothetical protein